MMTNKKDIPLLPKEGITEALLSNIPGMYAFWNCDLRCEYANKDYLKWFGISNEEMIGIHIKDLLGPELFKLNEPFMRKVLNGEDQTFERLITSPAGENLYGHAQYISYKVDNQVRGFFALVVDISKQKKLEQNLLKKTNLLKTINLINAILVRTVSIEESFVNICKTLVEDGRFAMSWIGIVNESSKLIEIQTSYGDKFGYLDGVNILVDTPPEKDGPVSIAIRTKEAVVVQDAQNDPRLAQWSSQRRKTNWHSSIALPILTEVTRAVLVVYVDEKDYFEEDVVEMLESVAANLSMFMTQKETEQQLLISAKLASLGEMSAGIAHEINNPLMVIIGSLKLLSRHSDTPEKLVSIAENIHRSSERINKIVQGLKKFSRNTEGGEYTIHFLSKIIDEVLILTAPNIKNNAVSISTDLKGEGAILCDEIEIEQVLINIVNNAVDAIKALPEKWIKIELVEDEDRIVLRLIDSGKGIPEAIQKKIFDPFFTTKPIGEGTGLGLSVSKGILEKHKAKISVLTVGGHTCFEIIFHQ